MKYLNYSYSLNLPQEEAFRKVIDIMSLQASAMLFEGASLSTKTLRPEEVGKSYVVSINAGSYVVETTITVQKVVYPEAVEMSYEYQTADSDGKMRSGAPLPWESMKCVMAFQRQKGKTTASTTMFAVGVDTIIRRITARILSIINYFQQQKIIRRVINAVDQQA